MREKETVCVKCDHNVKIRNQYDYDFVLFSFFLSFHMEEESLVALLYYKICMCMRALRCASKNGSNKSATESVFVIHSQSVSVSKCTLRVNPPCVQNKHICISLGIVAVAQRKDWRELTAFQAASYHELFTLLTKMIQNRFILISVLIHMLSLSSPFYFVFATNDNGIRLQ